MLICLWIDFEGRIRDRQVLGTTELPTSALPCTFYKHYFFFYFLTWSMCCFAGISVGMGVQDSVCEFVPPSDKWVLGTKLRL